MDHKTPVNSRYKNDQKILKVTLKETDTSAYHWNCDQRSRKENLRANSVQLKYYKFNVDHVHSDRTDYQGRRAQAGYLDFHTDPEL